MNTEYDKQAADFLKDTQSELKITYLYTGTYFHDDTDERDIYGFTITTPRGSYSSKFGDSIHNTERRLLAAKGRCHYAEDYAAAKKFGLKVSPSGHIINCKAINNTKPSAYDILACLEKYTPDTFEAFCDEYGYSHLSIKEHDKIMKIFLECKEQSQALQRIFSPEQLEQLEQLANI